MIHSNLPNNVNRGNLFKFYKVFFSQIFAGTSQRIGILMEHEQGRILKRKGIMGNHTHTTFVTDARARRHVL